MGLYWIDTISGAVLSELSDFMTRQEYEEFQFDYLNFPIPIGDGQVYWFFSGGCRLERYVGSRIPGRGGSTRWAWPTGRFGRRRDYWVEYVNEKRRGCGGTGLE